MRKISFWLALFLIFTIPWENALTITGIGTFTKAIGLLLVGVWIVSMSAINRFRKPHLFHFVFCFFVLFNISSIFWTQDILESIQRTKTYIQLLVFALILWDLFDTSSGLRAGLQAYILGAYITIGSTVLNYINERMISLYEVGRYAGANLNANDLALILALGIPVAWHLANTQDELTHKNFLRLINFGYFPIAIFTIALTASRTSLFVLVPAILYIILSMHKIKHSKLVMIIIVLILIFITFKDYVPQESIDRLATVGDSIANRDFGGRIEIWNSTISVFLKHPVFGIGSGALKTSIGGVAHNTFLSILAELGIIGLTNFLLIISLVFYNAIIQFKKFSLLWLTVFLIWLIGSSVLTWEYTKPTWLFMSFIIISSCHVSVVNPQKD